MSLIIGLTGGIGSGKTSATRFFAAEGIAIIDADTISHELTGAQGDAIPNIKKYFGVDFITKNGKLDRKKMKNRIFSDINSRKKLEEILHPLIQAEVMHRIENASSPYIIVVAPLLLETGDYCETVTRILVVDCNEEYQISRTVSRDGLSKEEVRTIMAAQKSRQERLDQADDVIVNDTDISSLQEKVKLQHNIYLSLLQKKSIY
ncbi:dephospho-CoA kinase [Nitrosomonadaceae bacterium]|nr:dephospho-CoA kinase [Nitrosomonadaceae bacterium]